MFSTTLMGAPAAAAAAVKTYEVATILNNESAA
jgi:hypothetical protein